VSAGGLLEEADEIADATGTQPIVFGAILLAACRGDERRGMAVIEAGDAGAVARSEGVVLTFGEHARALLYNSLGQHAAAIAPAQRASDSDELMLSVWALPELVEAAARADRMPLAKAAADRLAERAAAAGTDLALGIQARARALVGDGGVEELYREAVDRLGRSRFALDRARAQLLYGEWLRREQRRADAREQLRAAYELFASMGAEAFAERTRRELLATGETIRARTPDARNQLTAQEAQIAELASDGLSNPEIAARLYISPRTVQYHLHKVFAKLDISSRNQLHRALPRDPAAA
jgi:DNA-binding CsgD family transcriptional regulator